MSLKSLRVWESARCVYNFFIAFLSDNFFGLRACYRLPSDRPTPCRGMGLPNLFHRVIEQLKTYSTEQLKTYKYKSFIIQPQFVI